MDYPAPEEKLTYKVKFHIIRDIEGNRADFVGEEIVMNVIRDLNLVYNTGNIYFKYIGFDYVDDSSLSGDILAINLLTVFHNYANDTSSLHLIVLNGDIVNYYDNNNPIITPGVGPFNSGVSFYNYHGITSTHIPSHEIGHNFGLKHNFSTSENVVRFYNYPGYNALVAGDKIFDTPACKTWDDDQFNELGIYFGNDIDNNTLLQESDINRRYSSQNPKNNNVMYVRNGADLIHGYEVTPEQVKRMRYVVATDFSSNYYNLYNSSTSWEELYKPFETKLVPAENIASITDNNNGTATVCRGILRKDRYQKGFKYIFFNDTNENIQTGDSNTITEITSGIRNYFIQLYEVYPDHREKISVPCYRGTICENEDYVSGKIYSTQVLGSMNITLQELNQIEVKDPDLYNKLMEQYYHILKKYTTSGAVDQKIIYKQ